MSKLLAEDPAVIKIVERATSNVHKFFKAERRQAVKKIRDLVAEHAADAKLAGNPDGAKRIKSFGVDLVKILP